MKKCWIVLCMMVMLTGCGAAETFETVGDDALQSVIGPMRQLVLTVPESAAASVMNSDNGDKLYLCDGYTLTVQTLDAGDLNRTVQTISGFSLEKLTVVETGGPDVNRYDWVWTAAGEGGEQIGRAAVLDDGAYHYCVTAMADVATVGGLDQVWGGLFTTLSLR